MQSDRRIRTHRNYRNTRVLKRYLERTEVMGAVKEAVIMLEEFDIATVGWQGTGGDLYRTLSYRDGEGHVCVDSVYVENVNGELHYVWYQSSNDPFNDTSVFDAGDDLQWLIYNFLDCHMDAYVNMEEMLSGALKCFYGKTLL